MVEAEESTLSHTAFEDRDSTAELEAIADLARGRRASSSWPGAPTRAAPTWWTGTRSRVGRHPESTIFLDDITVSRRHSVIERAGDEFQIQDVGSLNGTYVNHDRVDYKADRRRRRDPGRAVRADLPGGGRD